MGGRLPCWDLPSEPTVGTTLDAPGASDFSAAGRLAIDREKAGWDCQGKLLGSLPVRATLGQPTGVFADHFLVPSQQPLMVAGNQGTSPSWLKTRLLLLARARA